MRIWSLHPQYLDPKGLVALWRETLLAQNVLLDKTKGYKNHPQLIRFKAHKQPVEALCHYLHEICNEAEKRGYQFNRSKIMRAAQDLERIPVTQGQMDYEWKHLLNKLETRNPALFLQNQKLKSSHIQSHPLFIVVDGEIEPWEKF